MANPRLDGHRHRPRRLFRTADRSTGSGQPYLAVLTGTCLFLLLAACSTGPGGGGTAPQSAPAPTSSTGEQAPHPYVGMWVTADGHIRQMLLPEGRYDEARGERESAYTGAYRVTGNRIEYDDDTGFSAHGTFDGDVLHHAGYVFYREGSEAHRTAREG
ncbi:Atu4866 domain-containing protein [Micromonospora sp. DT229]|uniref:Atu4866 domain-containing protein n=1 Tax=Micromonospora sp. DT229 TaxID=3393430 RepID=UPI003CF5AC09